MRARNVAIAGALVLASGLPDPAQPARLEPHRPPTTIVFGAGSARVLRPAIGRRHTAVRVQRHGLDFAPVTPDEYSAWILAGRPDDTDAFLEELRQ